MMWQNLREGNNVFLLIISYALMKIKRHSFIFIVSHEKNITISLSMNHMLTHVSADQISIIKSTEFYLKRARHDDGNSSIDCYIH